MSTTASEPKLDPPGAGLPWLELQVANFGFHFLQRRATPETSTARMTQESAAILQLVQACDRETDSQRVLIKRLPGLEDSSRYWSIFMTLDHLRIVNLIVADVIRLLGQGKVPPGQADTARVKPSPEVTPSVVEAFQLSCQLVQRSAGHVADLKTTARYAHPWFGPLDASGWYFLAGFHLGLHRQQILEILLKKE